MTYTEIPVSAERLIPLWCNLWDRGREELDRIGLSMAAGFRLALDNARNGRSGILLADGRPVMASGIMPDGDAACTWFQATHEFDLHARAITKTLRREVKAWPGQVHIYSVMVHPQTERWFRTLGFVRDDWTSTTAANWPLFRFSRADLCA